MKTQRGITLLGLLLIGFVLVLGTVIFMKLLPEYLEYYAIKKDVKAVASDPGLKAATVADIRLAYAKRANIDQITAVTHQDIDITKDAGNLVISFAYSRKVPLVANISLVIDFEGSSAGS
jgi:amino acid transporter